MARRSARGGHGKQDADFRRLAAQLGVTKHVLTGEDTGDTQQVEMAVSNIEVEHPNDIEGDEEEGHDDDEEESVDFLHISEADIAVASARLKAQSDSNNSASESLSSDLSLPQSFGHYEHDTRRIPFQRISQFDDQLMRLPGSHAHSSRQQRMKAANENSSGDVTGGNTASGEMMKKFYQMQVEKIRSQLVLTTQAKQQMEKALQEERAAWQKQMADMERENRALVKRLEQENDGLRAEVQTRKKQLKLEKTHFTNLQISDALAEQLARQNEEDLSIREFIQLMVHSKVRKLEVELETCRREMETLKRDFDIYKSTTSTVSEEIAQVRRVAEAKEMRLKHELQLSEATRQELERQLASLYTQIDALKDEQKRNEELYSNSKILQAKYEKLKVDQTEITESQRLTQQQYEELLKQNEELEQKVMLLSSDKAFLQDDKARLEAQEVKLLAKQRSLVEQVDALQAKRDQDMSQSIHIQQEARLHFEKKLEDEMNKFMELSKQEIERIRNNGQIVYERENRLLKEARDDALKQVEMLQMRVQSLQTSLDEKVLEKTRSESSHTTALASVRNELKMKHFEVRKLFRELSSKPRNYDGISQIDFHFRADEPVEDVTGRESLKLTRCKARSRDAETEKLHKEEFAKLETASTTKISQLEAALEAERTKLKEYEQLEVDLDDAVLQTGAVAERIAEGCDDVRLREVMTTFGAIPSTTKRRFQQNVLLAQRVVKYQREALRLEQEVTESTAERRKLEQEVTHLKSQLATIHQPQSYLIDKLKRNDGELKSLNNQLQHLQQQHQQLQQEYQQVIAARMSLQKQLQQVLAGREDLDALKSSVLVLRQRLQSNIHATNGMNNKRMELGPADGKENQLESKESLSKNLPIPFFNTSNLSATSADLKKSPPPSIISKMTRPPTPQKTQQEGHSSHDHHQTSAIEESSPPNWYTKLRS